MNAPANDNELEDLTQRAVNLVHRTLNEVAGHHERQSLDYAATFLGCVTNAERSALVQIGDRAIGTVGLASLADVATVQDQPVMAMLSELLRYES